MKYIQKMVEVDAWEYNHSLDIAQFKGVVRHCVGTHGHVMTVNGEIQVIEGDFIVKQNGHYEIMSAETFHSRYDLFLK